MVKQEEKPKAEPTIGKEENGVRKLSGERKKPPPGKPYVIKKTWL